MIIRFSVLLIIDFLTSLNDQEGVGGPLILVEGWGNQGTVAGRGCGNSFVGSVRFGICMLAVISTGKDSGQRYLNTETVSVSLTLGHRLLNCLFVSLQALHFWRLFVSHTLHMFKICSQSLEN